ncbi:30S ribosomal protein S6, partial [Candidatus Pelagibacter sp.]|nr:30S ribosomal protein S6 [Candidatus Pelagibacter sp.]
KVIEDLEKNESLDKKLLRYLTVRVKKFDLDTVYFGNKNDSEKKESIKN